jgi:mannosyltransferase OCH1-like enzyme
MIPNRAFRVWVNDDSPLPDIRPVPDAENIVITRADRLCPDDYARDMFEAGDPKYGDYIKFWLLWKHGGVYVDCDVIPLKPLTDLLDNRFFAGRQGSSEDPNPYIRMCCTAVMGSEQNNIIPFAAMKRMRELPTDTDIHEFSMGTLNRVMDYWPSTIYPQRWFYPFLSHDAPFSTFGPDTYMVHLWAGGWTGHRFEDCFNKVEGL